MKFHFFSKMFLRGCLALLPLILTIYPLYYFFSWIDSLTRNFSNWLFPGIPYIPGTGIVFGVIAIILLGVLMSSRFVQRLYYLIETPIRNIPLVRSLYSAIKELIRYLAPSDDEKAKKVVSVRMPGQPVELIGFVIRDDLSDLPDEMEKQDRVAVYIPMSYQIGGFTLFLPTDWLTPLSISVDDAMKNVLTGWITGEKEGTRP